MAHTQLNSGSQELREVVNELAEAVDDVESANVGGSLAGLSVVGRAANSTGVTAAITAASDGQVLRRSGTAVGFGTIAAAGLASDAVTGVKIAAGALKYLAFTGKNGAGAITLTGAAVGDKVAGVANTSDGGSGAAAFETTITVADQIQQSSASDLSTKKYTVLLISVT